MRTENWLPVEGYERLYEVSSEGRVRSLNYNHTGETRILKAVKNKDGYLQVCLHKEGKQKLFSVHRLVANTFVPNMFGDECVNHINEDKSDNRADNLMWCDWRENNVWGSRIQRVSETQRNDERKSKLVLQFSKSGELVKEWPSTMEVQRVLGFNQSGISDCCLGKIKSYKGFVWKYL